MCKYPNLVCRILKNNLYHPYKPLYNQFLCDGDSDRRLQFCQEMLAKFDADPSFLRKLAFSDECVFSLCGNVNKHNGHYWATQNPMFRIGNPGKTPTLTIGPMGLHLLQWTPPFRNTRYNNELRVVLWTSERESDSIFHQRYQKKHACSTGRCTAALYSRETRRILNTDLSERWIGRRGHVKWPARSPDLTPVDFRFWSHLRQRVYPLGFKYANTSALEQTIIREMHNIPLETYRKSMKDFRDRITKCLCRWWAFRILISSTCILLVCLFPSY